MEERFVVWHAVIDKTHVSSSMRQIKIYTKLAGKVKVG